MIELLIGLVLGGIIAGFAFFWYRHIVNEHQYQESVRSLQKSMSDAIEYLNHCLVQSGLSIERDSLADIRNAITSVPRNGNLVPIWSLGGDSTVLNAFGNYSGNSTFSTAPLVNARSGRIEVAEANAFAGSSHLYANAGATQEVVPITRINGNSIEYPDSLMIPYPRGTLLTALERLEIRVVDQVLRVDIREIGGGLRSSVRFAPLGRPGDSVQFRITALNPANRRLSYTLRFVHRSVATQGRLIERGSTQDVLLRAY